MLKSFVLKLLQWTKYLIGVSFPVGVCIGLSQSPIIKDVVVLLLPAILLIVNFMRKEIYTKVSNLKLSSIVWGVLIGGMFGIYLRTGKLPAPFEKEHNQHRGDVSIIDTSKAMCPHTSKVIDSTGNRKKVSPNSDSYSFINSKVGTLEHYALIPPDSFRLFILQNRDSLGCYRYLLSETTSNNPKWLKSKVLLKLKSKGK